MTSSIRSEDRLEGSSNLNNWKARIIAILEEHDLDQYVLTEIAEPTFAAGKATFKRNQGKARRIIYNSVRENIMPVITPLTTAKECYDTGQAVRNQGYKSEETVEGSASILEDGTR